jgi:hypothetical protein
MAVHGSDPAISASSIELQLLADIVEEVGVRARVFAWGLAA